MLTEHYGRCGQPGLGNSADDAERAGPTGGPSQSDADIVKASIGDPRRFGEIFDRYGDDILRYASARLGSDLAEDVTAETFLAAFRARSRYDLSRPNARPWLYGIAVRQIGSHRRAERRYRQALSRVRAETVAADFSDRVADRVTAAQRRPQLCAVLSGLSRQDRELLLLVAWTDLTYQESAQALGVSVSAVKSRLSSATVTSPSPSTNSTIPQGCNGGSGRTACGRTSTLAMRRSNGSRHANLIWTQL